VFFAQSAIQLIRSLGVEGQAEVMILTINPTGFWQSTLPSRQGMFSLKVCLDWIKNFASRWCKHSSNPILVTFIKLMMWDTS